MATALTISSCVARGHVGNSATTFPLMRLGHDVHAIPTVVLAHHPGHAPDPARVEMPDLDAMGLDVLASPTPHPIDALLIGYIANASQVAPIVGLIAAARALRPDLPVLHDPICGDNGALYVDPMIVAERSARLLPLSDVATPNVTELAALTAPDRIAVAPGWDEQTIIAHARRLGVPQVLVTSVEAGERNIANLLVSAEVAYRIETPKLETSIHGTGDLLAGLVLAGLLSGGGLLKAAATAAAVVHDVIAQSLRLGRDELALAEGQELIVAPHSKARVTAL